MNYFDNIINQDKVISLLKKQLDEDKTSHAYLFISSEENSMFECAIAFSKSYITKNNFDEIKAKQICERIDKSVFPDVHIIGPQGAQTYLVNQIKDIVNDVVLAPIEANCKIYIIKNAECLNAASANAFLKTLEEPPKNVCFILLANNENNVLPTIVSRCQVLHFNHLPYDNAISYIKSKAGSSNEDAEYAYSLFGGNTAKSTDYLLDQNLQDFNSEIIYTLNSLEKINDWDVLQKSKDINNKIKEITDNYKHSLELNTKDISDVLSSSSISEIEKQNKRLILAKQKDLLYLFCSIIQQYYKNKLWKNNNNDIYLQRINVVSKFISNLAYNINMQIFCDVVLIELKRI